MMKTKHPEASLEQIYRLNEGLFTLEKLAEKLYQ
jgi:hypothetical protein